MKLDALVKRLGFRMLATAGERGNDICRVYAGDRMSDLLTAADEHTLIVTHLTNHGLVRLIELMDVPAICFVNGAHPDEAVLDAACANGAVLVTSTLGMYETCGRLYGLLNSENKGI